MPEYLFAGAAEVEITPEPGLEMDGYVGREGESVGTHDPLMAQVLILKQESNINVVIVTLDVLAVSADFTHPLRRKLAETVGTVPEAVIICPSHTHCGPRGLQTWFPMGERPQLDMKLVSFIHEQVIVAARMALGGMEAVQLVWRVGEVAGIGGDRNQPTVPVDSQVTVLCCKRLDGSIKCILFHYACHPTVLGLATRYYSADFIGATRNYLQAAHKNVVCLYLNGALGDISSRFQRHDQSYAEIDRMGKILSDCIISMLKKAQLADDNLSLAWETFSLDLPFRNFSDVPTPVLITNISDRIEMTRAQGSILQTQLRDALQGQSVQSAAFTYLKIGSWKLLGIPGEPFNALALLIRQILSQALVVGLVNDYIGYFPTQKAIDMQTYEALSSPYDARALSFISSAFTKVIDAMNLTN